MPEQGMIVYIHCPSEDAQKALLYLLPEETRPDFDDEAPQSMRLWFERIDQLPYSSRINEVNDHDSVVFWDELNESPDELLRTIEAIGLTVKLGSYFSDDIDEFGGQVLFMMQDKQICYLSNKAQQYYAESQLGVIDDFKKIINEYEQGRYELYGPTSLG